MPSNKTLTIFIICLGIVVSVWFVTKKQVSSQNTSIKKDNGVSAEPAISIKNTDYDWKKILTDSTPDNQKIIDLTKKYTAPDTDNTLTDQMSRDLLSQYLIAAKNGNGVSSEMATQIAQNALSLPDYQPSSVVYIKENLKIIKKTDPITITRYKERINQVLIPVYYNIKDDPMDVMLSSLQSEKETDLARLDPIIKINKNAIKLLVEMEVPEGAISFHLNLLNSSSQVLSDLESMRVAISDPVKTFTVIGSYSQHMSGFGTAILNINDYLTKNSIINLF